jgi:hypothetical protein
MNNKIISLEKERIKQRANNIFDSTWFIKEMIKKIEIDLQLYPDDSAMQEYLDELKTYVEKIEVLNAKICLKNNELLKVDKVCL